MNELNKLSIRAMQALGATAVKTYCSRNNVFDPAIDSFIKHLWNLTDARDLPQWEQQRSKLELTGLGDVLPKSLADKLTPEQRSTLSRLCDTASEIAISQMYRKCNRDEASGFLKTTTDIAPFDIAKSPLLSFVSEHLTGTDGWGEPITEFTKQKWQSVANQNVLQHLS